MDTFSEVTKQLNPNFVTFQLNVGKRDVQQNHSMYDYYRYITQTLIFSSSFNSNNLISVSLFHLPNWSLSDSQPSFWTVPSISSVVI